MKKKFFCRQISLNGGINSKAAEIAKAVSGWDRMLITGADLTALKSVADELENVVEMLNSKTKRMRPAEVRFHESLSGGASIWIKIADQIVANFHFEEVRCEVDSVEDFFKKCTNE